MPSSIVVSIATGRVRWWNSELRTDLVEGVLGRREPELALEEGCLRWIPVRTGEIQSLGGVNELLCLLHYA